MPWNKTYSTAELKTENNKGAVVVGIVSLEIKEDKDTETKKKRAIL